MSSPRRQSLRALRSPGSVAPCEPDSSLLGLQTHRGFRRWEPGERSGPLASRALRAAEPMLQGTDRQQPSRPDSLPFSRRAAGPLRADPYGI